jgi:hypothetical protein
MAFVILAVVFLLAIVLIFFTRFQVTSMQQTSNEYRELRTITLLRTVASMPEFVCRDESNCIDEDKVFAYINSGVSNDYKNLWTNANIVSIVVEEFYPKSIPPIIYTIYSKSTDKNTATYSTFISLCSESSEGTTCKIGKIKITVLTSE